MELESYCQVFFEFAWFELLQGGVEALRVNANAASAGWPYLDRSISVHDGTEKEFNQVGSNVALKSDR